MFCRLQLRRFHAIRFSFGLLACAWTVAVVTPAALQAQGTTAVDPRLTADAARCLAIDNEVAELNAQARNGTLTKEAWKARTDALGAERTRITTAYGARNSPPYRGLITEFNRLKAEAAAEARARAAEEAKEKRAAAAAAAQAKREEAAAVLQAKREAAASEQAAKKAAAEAAAAEQARLAALAEAAVDADVSRVTDERLERARDKFYRDFGLTPPNPDAAVSQQAAAAQAIRAQHVPPASAELRPPFDQRVDRLYQLRLPDRTKEWFAEVFPTAADITSLFSDDLRKSAALELATRRLTAHTQGVRPYAAQEKIESYEKIRRTFSTNTAKTMQLVEDKAFEAEVFEKSLPAYARTLRARAAMEKEANAIKAYRATVGSVAVGTGLLIGLVLLWLPIFLMGRQKFRWKRQSRADWEREMAASPLLPDLWWVQVPGFRYPVTIFSGRVYDKDIWTETSVTTTTTTTAPTQYSYGHTSTSTHVSSTVYHRYWMVDTAGREVSHKYSDNEFIATAGQKVSSIWSDQYWVLLSYNHATGVLAAPAWWVKTMHTPPFWRTYLLMVLIAGGIATGVAVSVWPLLPGTKLHLVEQISILRDAMLVMLVPQLVLAMFYTAIVRAVFTWRRGRHFRTHVIPRFRAFLESYDPEIPEATVTRATKG
jgi:hypothetical protein